MSKSVSFGENTTYEIENISKYLWDVTFPDILRDIGFKLSCMVENYHISDELTMAERVVLIKHNMLQWVQSIVTNRDVNGVEIKLKGSLDDMVPMEDYNKVVIVLDFIDVIVDEFKKHKTKTVQISYGHDQTTIEFNIYPSPNVRLNITNMLSF